MNDRFICLLVVTGLFGLSAQARAGILLGTAGDYAVLAGSTVANSGLSVIDGGHIGVKSMSAITGFLPGRVMLPFSIREDDANTPQARNDFANAYKVALDLPFTDDLSGQNLGGLMLDPGVYRFTSLAFLTGILTLNAHGDPNAQFVFQVGSSLIAANNASVMTINGGSMPGCNLFWQIGDSATLGSGTAFEGHILAHKNITMGTDANIQFGSALANDVVTLDDNNITGCIPEASMVLLVIVGGVPLLLRRWRG